MVFITFILKTARILPNKEWHLYGKYFFQMITFKTASSLPCLRLFKLFCLFVLLQGFLLKPPEIWATEAAVVGIGNVWWRFWQLMS